MLDLAFVRENLPKVEEMLRRRGQDPAVLARFRETDDKRRQLITQSETLKAQRNRASEDIAKLKKEIAKEVTEKVLKTLQQKSER